MPESQRRFFQIHLSTAIALMFFAGGIMWANLRARPQMAVSISQKGWHGSLDRVYGWPFDACRSEKAFTFDLLQLSEAELKAGASGEPMRMDALPDQVLLEREWQPTPVTASDRAEILSEINRYGRIASTPALNWALPALAQNAVLGLAIMASATFVVEFLLRHRERKRREETPRSGE